ncbi:uncharacterized protein phf11 isoform X3 [Parambassis ranga]|uniref:Uncharacterized protein phf11 isoform X3 n=1 Tax=Parambassis ranga TaxID=210632 RepID=A0A6P7H1Z9_9TELE|nr:PHD finger protein 11 isoform X3 [Parambassis ranga]
MGPEQQVCCLLCQRSEETKTTGALSTKGRVTAHQYCLLFSSNIFCRDSPTFDDLFGFSVEDVEKEEKRGRRLKCSYCDNKGATAGCEVRRCKKSYHYPCAVRAGAQIKENTETGEYGIYCPYHRQKNERNGHASAETSNHRAPSKERCSTCERTEGNTVTVYCDKHAASSSHRKATDGGGPPPGRGSACSGGSSSRTSTRRSSSKRRLRVCDTQAENPSKRRPDGTRWNRIESDGSSTDLDDPNPDMALFAPLESDLEESASEQDAESDSLLPVVTCVISQAPQTVPQEQVVQQKTETTSSPPYSHVSETESLMLPVEICIDSEILLESNTQVEPDGDVSESERPLPPVETCMDAQSLTSPQPFTQIVSPAAEAAEGEHGGSSLFVPPASPRSRPGSPPCTSSNMSSGAPETSHVTPPSAGPPAGLTSDPQPSTDSVSFWKSCNAAGCTEAMFSDFISEMKSIYSRILSDEASQQDCDVALAVMEASGNLAALVAKQQKELQKKQLELQKAAAAMRNIVSALKR